MPKPTDYDKTHLRNMAAIGTRIDRIFKKATEEAAKIGVSIKKTLPEDRIFSFDDYPETRKQIERLMTALQESMETTIVSGVRSAWTLSNNKNNALVSRIFGDRVGDLSKEQYRRYFSTNGTALDAFLQRKEQGLNLSDRVWRYTNAFKHEIELGLDLGIRTGESAASMTRSLRQYLQHPDKLFRRVRDKHGNLQLSKAAQAFHPGRGVYRSSYKNARRLACTETNMAYRTSDHLRWQQMDFVVGIEIQLSNNHTVLLQPGERTSDPTQLRKDGTPKANAVRHLTDICDELKGRYPKDFKFVGWHPHCRCHAVTILKTEEEMQQDTQRILAGEKPQKGSVNAVRDVPAAFKDWVEEHSDRIEMGGNLPYFVKDNRKVVDRILGIATEPQKTPLEIAAERHANRKPEEVIDIQQRWNETRLRNLAAAIDDGYLPKEVKERLEEMLANNNPEHFEEINSRIAFYQKRAKKHMERDPKEIADIQIRWEAKQTRDRNTRLVANNVLKLRSEYPNDVDFSLLEKIIADNNLGKMRDEAKRVAQAIKAVRDEEKALSDLIPDAHGWHKTFTLKELQDTRASIIGKLSKWESEGMSLATNSDLAGLKKKLQFEIGYVEAPGKYKPGAKPHAGWQVAQSAYKKQLQLVETRIEIIKLNTEYSDLMTFSTTSKDFKEFMAKAKAALDADDPMTAQHFINAATSKKKLLEKARRKGGKASGGLTFDEMTKEKVQNLLLEYETNSVRGVDKELRAWMESEWGNLTYEEQKLLTRYTQAYTYLNDRLRGLPPSSWIPQSEYDHDMPIITQALNKLQVPRDMVVRRGTGNYEIKAIGKWLSEVEEGDVFTEPAFLSTAAHRDKGFFKSIEMVIVVPKGARGAFAEPFSHYNDSCSAYDYDYDRIWDGKTKQSIEDEFEWIGQRGCQFKVLQKTGNRIILQLIGQLK